MGSSNVRILVRPMQRIVFKFIRISVDGKNYWKRYENDSVDGNLFIRFRGENSVFKFIRTSVEGALFKCTLFGLQNNGYHRNTRCEKTKLNKDMFF